MSSLYKASSILSRPSLEASLIGESALIDKETGRVLWEGGASSTLSASLAPKLYQLGFSHLKATLLSILLLVGILGYLAGWLQHRLDANPARTATATNASGSRMALALLVLHRASLRIPKLDRWFLICTAILYLLEAYSCSTRRYLSNAVNGLEGVEDFIEQLRNQEPEVQWKVRCFHYEPPWFLAPLRLWNNVVQRRLDQEDFLGGSLPEPSLFHRKVITHKSAGRYEYQHCIDKTIAGLWRPAASLDSESPPFTKILLSQLVVLPDPKATDDYAKQQSSFVTNHGQGDQCAEFSTSIRIAGFKPQLLAIRRGERTGVLRTRIAQQTLFWAFTLMGLTVPYRMWFSDHCDVIRVTIVKEVSSAHPSTSKIAQYQSWFMSSSSPDNRRDDAATFRSMMQNLRLYATRENAFDSVLPSPSDGQAEIKELEEASREVDLLANLEIDSKK